jgi:hypothetical protein
MSSTVYRLVGFVVWRAVKWYLHEKLPSRRTIAVSIVAVLAGVATAGALLRRLAG